MHCEAQQHNARGADADETMERANCTIRTSMRTTAAPEAVQGCADDAGNTDGQTDPVRTAVGDSARKIDEPHDSLNDVLGGAVNQLMKQQTAFLLDPNSSLADASRLLKHAHSRCSRHHRNLATHSSCPIATHMA